MSIVHLFSVDLSLAFHDFHLWDDLSDVVVSSWLILSGHQVGHQTVKNTCFLEQPESPKHHWTVWIAHRANIIIVMVFSRETMNVESAANTICIRFEDLVRNAQE